jgi:hypothetical protein
MVAIIFDIIINQFQWFSGKISGCHPEAPDSISGWSMSHLFVVKDPTFSKAGMFSTDSIFVFHLSP